ncbi:MAG TPA: glycogen-binding domain-containing protein, partial [Gemmatimonadaceae bacterium]
QFAVSDGGLPISATRVAPSIQLEYPHVKFKARGSAFIGEQALQLADGIVSGTFTSPTVYGVRAEMIGNASRAVDDRSLGNDQIDVQTRVHMLFRQRAGLWFGGGVARPWRVAVVSSADVRDAGAWAKVGDDARAFGVATFNMTFTNFSFTKIASVHDSGSASLSCASVPVTTVGRNGSLRALFNQTPGSTACERQSQFGDLEGSMHWDLGALELTAQMGHRFGNSYDVTADSRRWSAATGTIWLNERIAVIAGGGRQPALPLRGIPARTYAMAGLELAYWPLSKNSVPVSLPRSPLVKSFEHHAAATGMQKIIIRVGGVETVDVMGDFSDWTPLTLIRRGRDLWELSIPMSPGVHQINVRVDRGQWTAPPNLPTTKDAFSGEVGLMVISTDK